MGDTGQLVIALRTKMGTVALDPANIKEFHFTEDIFSFSAYGKLIYHDRQGFIESAPLNGHEQVIVMYGSDESERDMLFDFYRVKKISPSSSGVEKGVLIEIIFVDSSYTFLVDRDYSRSWTDATKISDITEDILKFAYIKKTPEEGDIKIRRWEETDNELTDFIMPYWTPMKAIRWLNKRAKGNISGTSGYICYTSTFDGAGGLCMNCISMDALFGDHSNTTVKTEIDPETYYFNVGDSLLYRNKILDWKRGGTDYYSFKYLSGGHRVNYLFDSKRFTDKSYKYSETAEKYTMLGAYTLFPEIDNYSTEQKIIGAESDDEIDNVYYSGWVDRYSRQNSITVMVSGHESRFAGQQIDIKWESAATAEAYDINLTGKYLIKSITHTFGAPYSAGYLQKMTLLKNAYHDSKNTDLVKATRINKYTDSGLIT